MEISKVLTNRGHDITIITETSPTTKSNRRNNYQSIGKSDTNSINLIKPVKSTQIDHFMLGNVKVHAFDFGKAGPSKKFRIWRALLKHKNLIEGADIVHCHDVFIWYFPFRFLFLRKKVFTTFHGYESYPIKKKAIIIRKISELLSSGSICVGDFMKKWYGAKPDYVIYGGVTIPKKAREVDRPSAFFWGRLDDQTNVIEYCRAVKKIREKIPKFKFVIAGDGKFRKFAEKYCEVLGFIENPEEKLQKYRFAFVSRYLSILEAFAAKKMVFAVFDNPVKEDYLKMSPFAKFISISPNKDDLASKVHFYYSNKKIEQEMVKRGYKFARKRTWDSVVSIYEKLWEKNKK